MERFYLDVSVSTRDLHQKKLVQFFLQFLPGHISIMARTGRRTEQASSDEGLW